MANSIVKRIAEKLLNKSVYVQGTTPMLVPGANQAIYSPASGRLVGVYDEGIALVIDGDVEESYYFFANLRSIEPLKGASDLAVPKSGILLG